MGYEYNFSNPFFFLIRNQTSVKNLSCGDTVRYYCILMPLNWLFLSIKISRGVRSLPRHHDKNGCIDFAISGMSFQLSWPRRALPFRHRCLQHSLCSSGGDGRLHPLPHPQPLPAEHLALPGSPGGHAGSERGADPRGGIRCRPHPWRNPRSHWFWWVFSRLFLYVSSFGCILFCCIADLLSFLPSFSFFPAFAVSVFSSLSFIAFPSVFSNPLATQCAFCFPALIRLFFFLSLSLPVPQIISRLFVWPPSGLTSFRCHTVLTSHRSNARHYISVVLSSSVFDSSSLLLCSPRHLVLLQSGLVVD